MRRYLFLIFFFPALLRAQSPTFTSSNLPILIVQTGGQPIPDEPKIHATLTVIDNGPGQRNYLDQPATAYTGDIGIELHGNSSQQFPKKSLRFETRDADGNDVDVALLGMPETSDFVLTAGFSDKTLMRNALAYTLGRDLGHYAPRTRFCEVVVNNVYQGVYTLTERIKRGAERLDIARLRPDDTSGVDLTGGYLVSIDWVTTPNSWPSRFVMPHNPGQYPRFQHEYPRWDEIRPVQAQYIQRYVDSFEVALNGPDYRDSLRGWRRFADEASFIDFLIVNELSRNIDAYRLSTYFYKDRDDRGGKLHMGPLWDFDLAWYNANYCQADSPFGWSYHFNSVCPGDIGLPFWWTRLATDPAFRANLACRWQLLRRHALHRDRIMGAIDSMAAVLNEAQHRNFQRWPVLGVYVWPNPGAIPPTYAGEVQKMKTWIDQRLTWLDAAIGKNLPELDAGFRAAGSPAFQWQFDAAQPGFATYTWSFGDGATAYGPSAQHTFAAPGIYRVRLTVENAWGCTGTLEQTVAVRVTDRNAPWCWPNPARDWIELEWPVPVPSGPIAIELVNSLGQTVLQGTLSTGANLQRIELPGLAPGVYRLRVHDGTVWHVLPVVIG